LCELKTVEEKLNIKYLNFLFVFINNWIYFPFSSLQEVWVAVLNITGPLSSWSFAENVLPGMKIVYSS